jgi:hypothetical protein
MKRRIRPFGQMLGLADHSPWHAPTLTRLIDEVLEQPYRRNNKNQPLPRDLRNLGAPPTAIAVGTSLSERPPHRSGRAQLRHPALTAGEWRESVAQAMS